MHRLLYDTHNDTPTSLFGPRASLKKVNIVGACLVTFLDEEHDWTTEYLSVGRNFSSKVTLLVRGEPFFDPITCEGRVVMAGGELMVGSIFTFWLFEGVAVSSTFLGVDPAAEEVSGQVVVGAAVVVVVVAVGGGAGGG